jgi:hypothetical protein
MCLYLFVLVAPPCLDQHILRKQGELLVPDDAACFDHLLLLLLPLPLPR